MARWIVTLTVLGLLAGCQQGNQKIAREEAHKRWAQAQANLLCGLAKEYLKVGQLDSAAQAAREALSLNKDFTDAHLMLGRVYIEKGDYEQAEAEIQMALQGQRQSAEIWYTLGIAQEKAGKLDEALVSYRKSNELAKDSIDSIIAIGEVLVEMDKIAEAQVYVESNLNRASNYPGLYELAGRLAMMRNEYRKAEEFYQSAHDLDCKNLCYVESLGRCQLLAGRYARAIETLRSLTNRPEYKDQPRLHVLLGDALLGAGRAAEARDEYSLACEIDSSSLPAWVGMAKASLVAGEARRAILAAREAMKLDDTNVDAALVFGYTMIRQGQADQVVEVLTAVAVAHPENSMIRCLLGRAHDLCGHKEQAAEYYKAALVLEPHNQVARALAENACSGTP